MPIEPVTSKGICKTSVCRTDEKDRSNHGDAEAQRPTRLRAHPGSTAAIRYRSNSILKKTGSHCGTAVEARLRDSVPQWWNLLSGAWQLSDFHAAARYGVEPAGGQALVAVEKAVD